MSVKVNFTGRLGSDAETVTTQAAPFLSLRVAVNERVNREDVTTWMTVTADYERYKNLASYLTKGSIINVVGSERCAIYKSKSGQYGIDRKVSADSIEFVNLGKKTSVAHVNPNGELKDGDKANANAEMSTGALHSAEERVAPTTVPSVEAIEEPAYAVGVADDLPF